MNEIMEFLKHYSPLISLFTFLAGLYFGNKQAIGRDRRKEFNELAEPIIDNIEVMQAWLDKQIFTSAHILPNGKIEQLRRRLSKRKQKQLDLLLNNYRTALERVKQSPEPVINLGMSEAEERVVRESWVNHYPAAIAAITDLRQFLKLR